MTWISFVCLLALTSAAFGYSLGGYSQLTVPELPIRHTLPSGTRYQSFRQAQKPRRLTYDLPEPATLPLSEADIFCNGKTPDFVTTLEDGEKLIICTLESAGDEFFCPKGLVYSDETKRCEYKVNVNENVCASQPCLNGGRCIPTQYSYQCDCSQGFSGRTCELDASVCQQQQPCGPSCDGVCQSFHVGAALKHVCVLEDGRAYGLTGSQAFPNPCLSAEGFHPLAFGNKGYIMCDAKQMFIQSCPGGTVWDPLTEACNWPDMQGTVASVDAVEIQTQTVFDVPSKSDLTPTSSGSDRFRIAASPVQRAQSSSESGGFSASLSSDDDFTERLDAAEFRPVQVAAQQATPSTAGRFRSSDVDFTGRLTGGEFLAAAAPGGRMDTGRVRGGSSLDFTPRFNGGDFESTSATRGGLRGAIGRATGFPFAGTPGDTRNGRNQDDFDGLRPRSMLNDDSTSSSIRIPVRPSSSGNGGMERRGMFPSSFFSRPGEARRSS